MEHLLITSFMVEWDGVDNYVLSTGIKSIMQSILVIDCGVGACIEQSFSKTIAVNICISYIIDS